MRNRRTVFPEFATEKDTDGERSRRIDIYLSFIGQFPVPTEPVVLTPEEQKRQDQLTIAGFTRETNVLKSAN